MVRLAFLRASIPILIHYTLGQEVPGEPAPVLPEEVNATIPDTTAPFILDVDDPVTNSLQATAWSIIYTYAMVFNALILSRLEASGAMNKFSHTRNFPTPDSNNVVAPNLDVLYSFAVLDLSASDFVLTIPEIDPDRFWSFVVWDLYGNAIGEISNINDHPAGQYRILRDAESPVGLYLSENCSYQQCDYQGWIHVSTAYVSLAARVGILEVSTQDLDILRSYQDQMALDEAALTASTVVPSFADIQVPESVSGVDDQFKLSARLLSFNPTQTISDRQRVTKILTAAGIANGTYLPLSNVDLEEASAIANASAMADFLDASNAVQLGGDWSMPKPSFQGNLGTNYASQAVKAVYYQQTQSLALYPDYPLIDNTLSLNASSSILVTFSGKVPLIGAGFWNFGSYTQDLQLVPNDLDRYSIGSKSTNITYTKGSLVYGPYADAGDGEFQILLQVADLPPPANWTGNWLPMAETASLAFRVYGPGEAAKNGSYHYPTFETIPAIVA